ncbi:MAG: toprim domain-containing protein [Candidatus Pacearchaeota archaeon]
MNQNPRYFEILNEIQKALERNSVVIVEGAKDKQALEELGFQNITVLHGRAFYKKIEEITAMAKKFGKEVIILTDLDRKGRQFYIAIKKELAREGIKVNDKLRSLLLEEKISHIEGLTTFIENLQS